VSDNRLNFFYGLYTACGVNCILPAGLLFLSCNCPATPLSLVTLLFLRYGCSSVANESQCLQYWVSNAAFPFQTYTFISHEGTSVLENVDSRFVLLCFTDLVAVFVIFGIILLSPDVSHAPVATMRSKWVENIQAKFKEMGIIEKTASVSSYVTGHVADNETAPLPDPVPHRAPTHQRYLTIATMMKNQRRWLREWIEFHMIQGVEHFLIYDNESTDEPLDVLQYYIDAGHVTLIPWPPKETPAPYPAKTLLEEWQDGWFRDAVDTCIARSWTIHTQGPCQVAAFIDAIWRTKGGVSRWLGVWDVDEFLFAPEASNYTTLADTLRGDFTLHSQVRIWGNVFGTSGHVHTAQRAEGSPLQALVTEEYTMRSELDRNTS
jgi:hypothetical protein